MSLWNTLPKNIHDLIFQFDPTFREIYNKLIKEFLYRTPFWRVRYLHSNCVNDGKFENTIKNSIFISDYWNNNKLQHTMMNTDIEFLTDNYPNKYHIIFRDLNILKNYNWIFTDCEVRLIRKKITSAEKILTSRKRSKNNHRNHPYSKPAIKNSSSNTC